MCGICGYICSKPFADTAEIALEKMQTALKHRGPDAAGTVFLKTENAVVGLGQRRLAIIDLSSGGKQPMYYHPETGAFSEDFHPEYLDSHQEKSICITFNGEIYNYQEIKQNLREKGYLFVTQSDTEVILASYLEYGTDCIKQFNGMRAFALYDPVKGHVFCSRDRLGKKPLYYAPVQQGLLLGSELKALLASDVLPQRSYQLINPEAVDLYFNAGYIPSPRSIYTDIKKLPAGHSLLYTLNDQKFTITPYTTLLPYAPTHDEKSLIAEGRALLENAVYLRMMTSDVPVGAFLSGGLDSSSVVGEMTKWVEKDKLNTFSVGFEGKYDESEHIHTVEKYFGTNHHHIYFTQQDFDRLQAKLAYQYDEPLGDPSIFPTYAVSELAKKHVTVALSGDGGDEIFGGYPIHQVGYMMELYRRWVPTICRKFSCFITTKLGSSPRSFFGKIAELSRLSLLPPELFFAELFSGTVYKSPTYRKRATSRMQQLLKTNNGAFAQSVIDFDLFYNTLADNFLVKTDRASMAHGLEIRCPFLDMRLVDFSRKIPINKKVSSRQTKVLLRKIIKDIVPEAIVTRGKQGFTPPIEAWILQEKYMAEMKLGLNELVDHGVISGSWQAFYTKKAFTSDAQVYRPYLIRLFFFLHRYKERISA